MLLYKALHLKFSRGAVAFLKVCRSVAYNLVYSECIFQTPNFALNPEDVPRVEDGPMPSSRITLQHLEPPTGVFPIPARDAVFGAPQLRDENAPPPAILLDFMYGVAAYKRWGTGLEMRRMIHDKFMEEYQSIPVLQKRSNRIHSRSQPNYALPRLSNQPRGSLSDAMDEMSVFLMYASGVTPEMRMAEWQKEEEEKQLKNEAVSRSKVLEWMKDT